jgi:hypothetical protein
MSLSAVSVGERWADAGDYDEPDGDRPDGRVARSGGWQDQARRRGMLKRMSEIAKTSVAEIAKLTLGFETLV